MVKGLKWNFNNFDSNYSLILCQLCLIRLDIIDVVIGYCVNSLWVCGISIHFNYKVQMVCI